ncbi:DUF7144 family membrane protein [Natronoglycomyces albus]|uniref:DUF7144 domain-containing protein n=1 Tax=Natronoglycomyces albus TaxID=2811108 RepID=A0A895XMW6_9ACTN|nr:hypothetical protein [Natronoglycomyces albus]QSB04739.1 hypothetical protein JQS30_13325 [Natronoglycomyces albus]
MRVYRALRSAFRTAMFDARRYRGWVLNHVVVPQGAQRLAVAGIFLIVLGIYQAIIGYALLVSDGLAQTPEGYIFAFESAWWGVFHLVLAALVLVVAGFLFGSTDWSRRICVVLAGIVAVDQFVLLPVYHWWAAVSLSLALLVIWAIFTVPWSAEVTKERMPANGGGMRGVTSSTKR